MISVKDMITRIRAETHDHQKAGYPDEELLMYINDGLRFLRRTIMDIYPSMIADIDMEGELGDGENAIYTYTPIATIIDMRVDGERLDLVNPRSIRKLTDTGRPRRYYLSGHNCVKVWPVCEKPYAYSLLAVGDFEPLTLKDETPVPNEYDDYILEYAMIRMNMTQEFDLSQEQQLMSSITSQITSRIRDFNEPGVQLKSYW